MMDADAGRHDAAWVLVRFICDEVDALDATELEEAPDIAVQAEPPPAPLGE